MKQNKGFTLIELLVVVVIIGVIAGFVGVSLSTSGSASAKKSASAINSYLSELRINCMSRSGSPYAKLFLKDGLLCAEYYEGDKLVLETVLSDKRVATSYSKDGSTQTEFKGSTDPLRISYARSTGSLKEPDISGDLTIFVSGGAKIHSVSVVAITGRNDMD